MTDSWTAEQRKTIDELVLATAGLEPQERETVLAEAQSAGEIGSPKILAEVKRRLAAADAAGDDFLESPLSVFLRCEQTSPKPDTDEGSANSPELFAELAASERFEVGDVLGSGGMAEVYSAFDRRLDRDVALKLLEHSEVATEQRFLDEARAQARIRHENVLAIYDVGRLGDRPFLAMERVDGGTLADLGPSLPLEEKIRLVAQVAEGLHAAHRRGLIHRDVKPSNVLVGTTHTGERRAWVTDFGIAVPSEVVDRSSGSMLFGTPQYMAPERIDRGDAAIDRRSDVWSLGVLLYQLLAGKLPFDGATPLRILHAVQQDDRLPLGEQATGLPADLVAIVDRCLRRDPTERYGSARAVAEDLRRFLDGDVVEAHSAGLGYRLERFARRHRKSIAVAGALAAGLLTALIIAAVLGVLALRAERGLEQRQQQAERLVSFMLGDLRQRLEPLGRLDLLDAVGDEAMAYFAQVPESELTDDELGHRSKALHQIGSVRQLQGDLAGASLAFDESLHLAESLWQRDVEDYDRLFSLAQSHFWVGYASWQAGERDAAGDHFERYLELARRLVDLEPLRQDAWLELYYAHSNLGSWHQDAGHLEAALGSFEHAYEVLANASPAETSADPSWQFEMAAAENSLGLVKRQLGRLAAAAGHVDAELEIRRQLVLTRPDDRSFREFLSTALQYAATFDLSMHEYRRAEQRIGEATALLDALVAHDPTNGSWRHKRGWARSQAARCALLRGELQAAGRLAAKAVEDGRYLVALDSSQFKWHRLLAVALTHRGRTALAAEDLAAGRTAAGEALEIHNLLAGQRPQDLRTRRWQAHALLLAADLAQRDGDLDVAKSHRQAAHGAVERWLHESRDPDLLGLWVHILSDLGSNPDSPTSRLAELGWPLPDRASAWK